MDSNRMCFLSKWKRRTFTTFACVILFDARFFRLLSDLFKPVQTEPTHTQPLWLAGLVPFRFPLTDWEERKTHYHFLVWTVPMKKWTPDGIAVFATRFFDVQSNQWKIQLSKEVSGIVCVVDWLKIPVSNTSNMAETELYIRYTFFFGFAPGEASPILFLWRSELIGRSVRLCMFTFIYFNYVNIWECFSFCWCFSFFQYDFQIAYHPM